MQVLSGHRTTNFQLGRDLFGRIAARVKLKALLLSMAQADLPRLPCMKQECDFVEVGSKRGNKRLVAPSFLFPLPAGMK